MVDPFLLRFVSLGFTLLFFLASVHKLTGLEEFQAALRDYRLIPPGLVRLTAHLIPMVEVSLALGWLFAVQIQIVAYASAGLRAAYGLAMGINLTVENGGHAGPLEAQIEPADAGEERREPKRVRARGEAGLFG